MGGDVSAIEQEGAGSPEELRTAAMKEMAQAILDEAKKMADSYRLEQDPKKGTSFAWVFWGTERNPSRVALNLRALSEGQKTLDVEEKERQIVAAQTPEQKAQLEQERERLAATMGVTFSSQIQPEIGLAVRFGNRADQIADGLTNHFLQALGFLEDGKMLGDPGNPIANVERDRNNYRVTHSTKPFVAECYASGPRSEWENRGPRFEGFVLRYTPTPQTPQPSQP